MESLRARNKTAAYTTSAGLGWDDVLIISMSATAMFACARITSTCNRLLPMPPQHNGKFLVMSGTDKFLMIAGRVRSLLILSTKQRLLLYGLYKQATMGDAPRTLNGDIQLSFSSAAKDQGKWGAWSQFREISQERAMQAYVLVASELVSVNFLSRSDVEVPVPTSQLRLVSR